MVMMTTVPTAVPTTVMTMAFDPENSPDIRENKPQRTLPQFRVPNLGSP